MGAVMIRCPRTGRAVSTEIETEPSVLSRLPEVASRMHCPLCGEEHVWTASEAWIEEPTLVPRKPGDRPGHGSSGGGSDGGGSNNK